VSTFSLSIFVLSGLVRISFRT